MCYGLIYMKSSSTGARNNPLPSMVILNQSIKWQIFKEG